MNYVSTKKACEILGCCTKSLRNMDAQGRIKTIRTDANQRKYDINEYLSRNLPKKLKVPFERLKICYCRVSSRSQANDLERQVIYMQEKYPTHTIIKDIGSGLNFKRKGLQTILESAYKGHVEEVVVAYKDRLCRFGFELIESVLKHTSNAKIVVLNEILYSPEEELSRDILQILTVFSARLHGLRKYKTDIRKNSNLSE